MDIVIAKFRMVTSQAQLKDITAELAKVKSALGNLLTRAAGAEKALANAEQRLEKSEAKLQAEKDKSSDKAAKPVTCNVLHDDGDLLGNADRDPHP